jgi:hypothetical protein
LGQDDHIEVAVIDQTVFLKPFGFGTQHNSLGIPDFLAAMFRAGCRFVAFDLGECKGMDSTFLGVIADAACAAPHRSGKTVTILNASEALLRQLKRIGLLPLVQVHGEPVAPPAEIQLRQIDFLHFPKTEQQKLEKVKYLHEQLIRLNEKNKLLFGPFIQMLEDELMQEGAVEQHE